MILDLLTSVIQGIFTVLLKTWWIIAPILGLLAWQNLRKTKWAVKHEAVIMTIKIPRDNDKDPTAAEMLFATLHGILKPKKELVKEGSFQEHIGFEIVATIDAIQFYVWTPTHLKDFVEGQVYAQYPMAEISVAEDYSLDIDIDDDGIDDFVVGTEVLLTKNEILPIKTFQSFQVDPLAGITGVLSKLEKSDEQIWIQILARPTPDTWQNKGLSHIHAKKSGSLSFDSQNIGKMLLSFPLKFASELFRAAASAEAPKKDAPKLSSEEESKLTAIQEKATKLGYQVKIRTIYLSKSKELAKQRLQAVMGTFKQFNTTNLNGFKSSKTYHGRSFLNDYRARLFIDKGFILNIEEIASLYHLPHTSVETPNIKWTSSKTGEPPTELPSSLNTPKEDLTLFGETNFRHSRAKFGIKTDDRRRHTYIIGKSGMGKSKLLENFIDEDIQKGHGVAIIDPNGDLIYDVLKRIPDHRKKDVIILDPADQEFPVGFNPLEVEDEGLKHFIAQGFVGILKKMFGHSWGPRLEYVLNYTILALLDYPESTVLGIVRMLTDKNFRKKVVDKIKDPVVKKFWAVEFASYNDKFANEAVAPILNKVGQFTASSLIRNMIGQPTSTFSFREAMDNRKIILINLSTGRIGEVNSALLGGMIITKLQLAAMSRADIKPEDRIDFFLYVDEFQHFATESFATILSEARKYKLNLTMANQYIAQMEDVVREAVFGNVGTVISFRVGAQDAGFLEKELSPPFEASDIINLDRQQMYLKMTIDGQTSNPFSAKTLTVPEIDTGNTEEIIQMSRDRYGRLRGGVEDAINKWSGMDMEESDDVPSASVSKPIPVQRTDSKSSFVAPIVRKDNSISAPPKSNSTFTTPRLIQQPKPQIQSNVTKNTFDSKTKTTDHRSYHSREVPRRVQPTQATPRERKQVDKETLKEIIKNVVKDNITATPPSVKIEIVEDKKVVSNDNNRVESIPQKVEGEKRIVIHPNQDSVLTRKVQTQEKPVPSNPASNTSSIGIKKPFDHSDRKKDKELKIVTPNNFRDLKEIHPHEKVEVREHHEGEELDEVKPGETIIFNKNKGN